MAAAAPDGAAPEADAHPAIVILRSLLESGDISEDLCSELTFKFTRLHHAFEQSCSTEQILMRRTRDLDRDLKAQKMTIQNSAAEQQDHRSQLAAIRQLVTNIQVELDSVQEQIASTETNTKVKLKEVEKLTEKVDKAKEAQAIKLEPQRRQIQQEIANLEKAIQERRDRIQALQQQSNDMADLCPP
jgi:chromosome segregation ATPase